MKRVSVRVRGIVQGVGFRPFVQRAALARGLVGAVRNDGVGVEIDAQGDEASVDAFVEALRSEAPPAATVVEVNVEPRAAGGASRFGIEVSEPGMRVRPTLPADLAPCEQCSAEVAAPGDRRHGYPFTNCTQCGPRYTIATGLPYDRACTTMQGFALCGDCAREYADPSDRRYHAEPIACSRCGPKLFFAGGSSDSARGPEALHRAVDALLGGRIVALKGVGGYQLACDATNAESVACLRARKRRPDKPFALMFASPRAVREHAELSGDEERLLASQRAPIVLLRRRPGDRALAPGVAGRGPWLGAMLPSSPMHRLLLDRLARPMVCTSGNAAEEPICIDDEEAKERLRGITDAWLLHDRPIARPVDDSVARVGPTGVEVMRRARGWAPLPIGRDASMPTVLALGAYLKSTVALAFGGDVVVSQHLGDLDTPRARSLLESTAADLCSFFRVRPEVVACDLHPDYASTVLAERISEELSVPLERVQHHHAHVAACLAEHSVRGPVLGLAWDGAGLGDDGDLWGGEALVIDGARAERLACLRPFPLPGGEVAAREPRRAALGLLYAAHGEPGLARMGDRFSREELRVLGAMLATTTNSPRTTSIGRLFDAVASIVGVRNRCTFEGQAASELEALAMGVTDAPYPFPLSGEIWPLAADWAPLLSEVVRDIERHVTASVVSARFHASLASLAVAIARRSGLTRVALAGGCFQSLRLATEVRACLERDGFEVLSPALFPPNDGGIALGQAWIAGLRQKAR